ncbi:hypothetical protein UPYG_G00234030 [Umbra pygmaea]|uniref:Potassium channel domain-containing protein n=1 Tax=Umbra pygmaea TaxID=75934 RepID=A0ABD0WDZ5_UMBPY
MSQEGWTYVEGLYFSFVTLTTIGFGDLVAGVDPNTNYPTLYRYFVEVWIYLGLAWLSLFFNWKVRMVVEAHKALKKRRKLRKLSLNELRHYKENHKALTPTANDVNIFSFLSKKQEGYNDLIKQIGTKKDDGDQSNAATKKSKVVNRSKSCSDNIASKGHTILSLDHSPRQKRRYSFSDRVTVAFSKSKNYLLGTENGMLLTEDNGEMDLDGNQERMYENQLDKEEDLECKEGSLGGSGGCGVCGHRLWASKEYQSLIYPNANITFIDEDNLHNNNTEDDNNDDEGKLSITTCVNNVDSETNSKEEQGCESEGSVFNSDGSEYGHSYEKLVEEYSKEGNTES